MAVRNIDVDTAYRAVVTITTTGRTVSEAVKGEFEGSYNPFESYSRHLEQEKIDLRKNLIERTVEKYKSQYMPNAKPDADFGKLMDGEAGEQDFQEGVIKAWFEKATADKKALAKESLRQLQYEAGRLLRYVHDETGHWGKPKDPKTIIKGRFLKLHAYTWDTRWKSISTYNLWGELSALDKIISVSAEIDDLVNAQTHLGALYEHLRVREPSEFYKKIEVSHPTVKSFRFYKNGNFEIEFKVEGQATKAAELLLEEPEIQVEVSFQ